MNSSDREGVRKIDLSELSQLRKGKRFKTNYVRTSKYTWYNFIPINLFVQFTQKVANLYFLLIMYMQTIRIISISNGQPAMAPPLIFVVVLSMIKDAYEDYQRHKEDDLENNSMTEVYSHSEMSFIQTRWSKVKVGDVVRVNENEFFPADMIMLSSTEEQGVFYVETKSLDGETNLKLKSVQKDMCPQFEVFSALDSLNGTISIHTPNNRIHNFDGSFVSEQFTAPLSNDNVALRGMSLRNTESVTGIVVYSGHESKIQMNSSASKHKSSNISRRTNNLIFQVFMIQIILSSFGSIIGTSWMAYNYDRAKYLGFNRADAWRTDSVLYFAKSVGTWILIFTNMVPISLIVTLEIVKFWQGIFMGYDVDMYDGDQDWPCKAQTTNINEELGQIEYIFSDKTGTLTCNIMEFKKLTTRGSGSFNL